MNRNMPGLPVHHQLPESTQTNVHWVVDAIQPFHPLLSPSPPAPNPSQHQDLFSWDNSLHEVAKVLEFQLQHQSFQWTPRTDILEDGLVGSPCSPRDSQESSPMPQFKSMKEESEKAGLKLNIQRTRIMTSSPITSWQIGNGNNEKLYFLGAPKSLQMLTAAMVLIRSSNSITFSYYSGGLIFYIFL